MRFDGSPSWYLTFDSNLSGCGVRNKNTSTELLTLFDKILDAKEKKKEILVLLYDLSSAFDTVSHNILLEKLHIYGFCKLSLNWMKSYLNGRKQKVEISGKVHCKCFSSNLSGF